MRFAEETQRQLAQEQARQSQRLRQDAMSTPSFTTPSTPSTDMRDDLYLEDVHEEQDTIEHHLAGWRSRRAERIQAYVRRAAAVQYFRKARAAATMIQCAARARAARSLMLRRRAAAALITRMGKGRLPKKLARRGLPRLGRPTWTWATELKAKAAKDTDVRRQAVRGPWVQLRI